jgi:hypothetical protein
MHVKHLRNGREPGYIYFSIIGFFSSLLIFNQIYIGTNLSLLWVAIIFAPFFCRYRAIQWNYAMLVLYLGFFLLKFLLAANIPGAVRYLTYIGFVWMGAASMREAQFERFFSSFQVGIVCNIAFACLQMLGKLSHAYEAVLPVTLWNPSLWHINPDGGMFTFLPRVSGFTNEPAYLGTVILAGAAYRLFIQEKQTLTGRYGLYLFLSIIFLVNSRTAFLSYIWLAGCGFLLILEKRRIMHFVIYAIYAASFVLLALVIIYTTDTGDLKLLADDDISVFARVVPLTWIKEGNNLTLSDYLFGVGDYRAFSQTVNMSNTTYTLFELQGGLLDSKSLGGAYFFDLGILGLIAFIAVSAYLCRGRVRSLLFMSMINVTFFNFYAFSWPLFWLCVIACGLKKEKRDEQMSLAVPEIFEDSSLPPCPTSGALRVRTHNQ